MAYNRRASVAPFFIVCMLAAPLVGAAEKAEKPDKTESKDPFSAETFAGLKLRGLGPALTSGRIIDIAVDEKHPGTWYVAAASGGVWKTENAGTTWSPVFEGEGSYSIGC